MHNFRLFSFVVMSLLIGETAIGAAKLDLTQVVNIDGSKEGRVFEGIGALSAGASSRLLPEYPEPQRSDILDMLFKPKFGASLHHLKVEIGGDVNSTCGSEPSHAFTRAEFEHPKREYFDRGYEWWLMKEARKRNPGIILDTLQWGAPGWIGKGEFFSQDNADFIASFLKGARDYHGLTIQYQGIRNESGFDKNWSKLLRQTLDRNGLHDVKLVAADQVNDWSVVNHLIDDPEFDKAIDAVGIHYPGYASPEAARNLSKPLWASEDGPWRGDWEGARSLAKIYNRNYIQGRMTKTIIWSPISSYYDSLALAGSGLMRANTPWSGHYEVQPAIWATAHTTQFAQPGWKYIDSGCGLLTMGGSFVTLKAPDDSGDYSIIIETVDAPYQEWLAARTVNFVLSRGLSTSAVHVWRTTESNQFEKLADITPVDGTISIGLVGKAIYTLTTTTGQHKGTADIPAEKPFPFPYREDFESYEPGRLARYISDQHGSFAVVEREDGMGKCLRQFSPEKGIEWFTHIDYPLTLVGNDNWTDYEVIADVNVPEKGYASIIGRANALNAAPQGYALKLYHDGAWELCETMNPLDSGKVDLSADAWHNLRMQFSGSTIAAFIDGERVTCLSDSTHKHRLAGLGSSWINAGFDNLEVRNITGRRPRPEKRWTTNYAIKAKATSSSDWTPEYSAGNVNDGDSETRWNSRNESLPGEWVELDFGKDVTFDRVTMTQFQDRIMGYIVQYWDGKDWKDVFTGENMGTAKKIVNFPKVKSNKVRLYITALKDQSVSIQEFQVFMIGK
ncbi:MAG: discoidin domain-containing protein [Armatimonadota bacterium]